MRINFLIGGEAGQGVNKAAEIVSRVLIKQGYYVFNYRDYPSLIRGGHNFNLLSISDKKIGSYDSRIDAVFAMDKKTLELHKNSLKNKNMAIDCTGFKDLGRDINVAVSGAFLKILGVDEKAFIKEVKDTFGTESSLAAAKKGYESQKTKYNLKKINNKIKIMSGSRGVALGAINSELDIYIAYPMTPSTPVMHELAGEEYGINKKNKHFVFQAENEISVINSALGASFAGKNVMIGSSGGGFDLMGEGLSLQGMSAVPLTVYLASRSGPASGVPTYTSQADLNIALRSGHGEFPRVVVAPGDAIECIEKTNEAIYLSQKFNSLSIVFSDKHLAESEYSYSKPAAKTIKVKPNRDIPGVKTSKPVVRATSYDADSRGNTIEDAETIKKNAEERVKRYENIKKECEKFEMFKIHGKKTSKNLVISWGSTKGAVLDAIGFDGDGEKLDCRFLQVLYIKPFSKKIQKELEKAENIILVENNITGQLGRVVREHTGIKVPKQNRILKYDARPFTGDELKKEIKKRLK